MAMDVFDRVAERLVFVLPNGVGAGFSVAVAHVGLEVRGPDDPDAWPTEAAADARARELRDHVAALYRDALGPVVLRDQTQFDRFVGVMARKLRANDHKDGWTGAPLHHLLARLCDEVVELLETFQLPEKMQAVRWVAREHLLNAGRVLRWFGQFAEVTARAAALDEAADVANFAFGLATAAGTLGAPQEAAHAQ